MVKYIFLLYFLFGYLLSYSQLSEFKQKQLDSLVTNIERPILKNLDSVHRFIHNFGATDEERVFMFYGLISIHYNYDMKRFWESSKESKEYTPHYTAYNRKGVCGDFSVLFLELCKRSNIPSAEVYGKVPNSIFLDGIPKFFMFRLKDLSHAWNVVKFNGEWHHMDATWSHITKIEKYYECEENGEVYYVSKAKRADKTYYDISWEEMYDKRWASHPAYYAQDTVYSRKTVKRDKAEKRKIYTLEYDYNAFLDSIFSNPYYVYSSEYRLACSQYSGYSYTWYYLNFQFEFLENKRSKFNKITPELCDIHLAELRNLLDYIEKETGYGYQDRYTEHEKEVLKYKDKLIRKINRNS